VAQQEDIISESKRRILNREACVVVVGAGYVGLPLAVEKVRAGFDVTAIDRKAERVDMLNRGDSYIPDVPAAALRAALETSRFSAATDFSSVASADVIIICVPTPLTVNREPDLSYIRHVTEEIGLRLKRGQLVCLESTTYPGTTEEVILPILEGSGLRVGEDFFLAFSPERVDPGNARYTTRNINKLVGGVTPACRDVAMTFYSQTIREVIAVSSPRVAEMAKVFENTYRAVNIALVNEMALLCDRMGVDVWEVLDAAFTKPFGIQKFYPGPGVGGHCIPVDPFYLAWKAREYDFSTRFIELAGEINLRMPYFVVEKAKNVLESLGRTVRGANVLVLGMAYKKDVSDARESPALRVFELLRKAGAEVVYHDPLVPEVKLRNDGSSVRSVDLSDELLDGIDLVIIATDHSRVDYRRVVDRSPAILDCRNATRSITQGREKVTLL